MRSFARLRKSTLEQRFLEAEGKIARIITRIAAKCAQLRNDRVRGRGARQGIYYPLDRRRSGSPAGKNTARRAASLGACCSQAGASALLDDRLVEQQVGLCGDLTNRFSGIGELRAPDLARCRLESDLCRRALAAPGLGG